MDQSRLVLGILAVVCLSASVFILATPLEQSSQIIVIKAEEADPESIDVQPAQIRNGSLDSQYFVRALEEAKRGEQSSVMVSKRGAKQKAVNDLPDEAPRVQTGTQSGYYVKWEGDYYVVEIWKLV
ncbi:hypothetical protein [Halolamina sp.]|jgi:hypothetical protein|uniref:hypothetical protein n=1 Tax=Halolamina sp. TaxID=1940283 RepID=UPI000223BAC8|nr:hypothetical protein Halar_2966 [halophilic archaeon DL31]